MKLIYSFCREVVVPLLCAVLILFLCILAMFGIGGCTQPEKAYLEADRANYEALVLDHVAGPGRVIYGLRGRISGDTTMTTQEIQDWLDLIDAWELRLKIYGVPPRTGPPLP